MPIDLWSVLVLIMLNAADMVERLGPYIVSGIIVATLLSWIVQGRSWTMPSRMPRPLVTPLACLIGVVSPLPTTGVVPVVVRLRAKGLPAGAASAFVLVSSLMNPQLLLLTAGAFGMQFALMQLGSVLILSVGMGLMLAWGNGEFHLSHRRLRLPLHHYLQPLLHHRPQVPSRHCLLRLRSHPQPLLHHCPQTPPRRC